MLVVFAVVLVNDVVVLVNPKHLPLKFVRNQDSDTNNIVFVVVVIVIVDTRNIPLKFG